jgi:hypothetical protein
METTAKRFKKESNDLEKAKEKKDAVCILGIGCCFCILFVLGAGSGVASLVLIVIGSICLGGDDYSLCLNSRSSAIGMVVAGVLLWLCTSGGSFRLYLKIKE